MSCLHQRHRVDAWIRIVVACAAIAISLAAQGQGTWPPTGNATGGSFTINGFNYTIAWSTSTGFGTVQWAAPQPPVGNILGWSVNSTSTTVKPGTLNGQPAYIMTGPNAWYLDVAQGPMPPGTVVVSTQASSQLMRYVETDANMYQWNGTADLKVYGVSYTYVVTPQQPYDPAPPSMTIAIAIGAGNYATVHTFDDGPDSASGFAAGNPLNLYNLVVLPSNDPNRGATAGTNKIVRQVDAKVHIQLTSGHALAFTFTPPQSNANVAESVLNSGGFNNASGMGEQYVEPYSVSTP